MKRQLFEFGRIVLTGITITGILFSSYTDSNAYANERGFCEPEIVDSTNTVTEEQKERLLNEFEEVFPETDLSMYTLYSSEAKSENRGDYTRIGFDVYYNNTYVYDGFEAGDVSADSIVCIGTYDGTEFENVFSEEFYEQCLKLDFSNIISEEDVAKGLYSNAYIFSDEAVDIELVIYNSLTGQLGSDVTEIAYKAKLVRDEEEIIFIVDAETNEVVFQESNIVYNESGDNSSVEYTYSESGFELKCTIKNSTVTIDEINVIQATELKIPDTINGCPVIAIAENAFLYSQMHLDSITIPEGVTSIGEKAFVGQHGTITSVILPKSVASIGEYAIGYFQNGIKYTLDSTTVVYGYTDTVAELYATNNCITFEELNSTVEYLAGDVNSDGKFTVADVVALQKWLLAKPDVVLENWKAGDLCEDNSINVFDLCLMKRKIIEKSE